MSAQTAAARYGVVVPEAARIQVTGIGEAYDVTVSTGLLDRVGEFVTANRAAIVTNEVVGPLYLDRVEASLRAAGIEPLAVIIPDGEAHKSMATLQRVYDALLSQTIERSTPIIALGGGVITDLAGFAAATMLRGVPLISVPTSLLAMVDASVGGKTGVNHAAGKNLIGAFHPPAAVLIDPTVLVTLPDRELRGGLAECIKHDVIRDADHLAVLEANVPKYLVRDVETLTELIAHNVHIKAAVVAADPYERGERAHLNFGHTFGHAFEKATHFALSHGEAVGVGMICAVHVAVAMKMMEQVDASRVERLIAAAGLPVDGVEADLEAVLAAMQSDKKVVSGQVRFVLPTRLGEVTVRGDVPPATVRMAVESVLKRS